MKPILNQVEFDSVINKNSIVLAYFSHKNCSVCNTLKPKLNKILNDKFPKLIQIYIDIEKLPEIAGQQAFSQFLS